jgi:hypothetical protein
MENKMKISLMKECVELCGNAGVTALIWGNHGIGKSQGVKQLAVENNWGFIDMRLSQAEASDLRGFPDKEDGRTKFCPPYELPQGGMEWDEYEAAIKEAPEAERWKMAELLMPKLERGILLLDEINRAQDDVIQAAFQLVLDRKVGQYVLPPGWNIVCASNPQEGYIVNGFNDPAFLDRFCHIQVDCKNEDSLGEWVEYISAVHGPVASQVVEFASQDLKHLNGDVKSEIGFGVTPSRRSWEFVIRVEDAYRKGDFSGAARTMVLGGLVGMELAASYNEYSCPVKPAQLIENGVKAMRGQLESLERGQMQGLMWGLVGFVKPQIESSDKHAEVALDFAEFICERFREKDLAIAFCKSLVASGKGGSGVAESVRAAALSNPQLAKLLKRAGKPNRKRFLDRLSERPKLQDLLSKTAWGSEDL